MDTALLTACIPGALLIAGILYFFGGQLIPDSITPFAELPDAVK
jgi:hypothetical protein